MQLKQHSYQGRKRSRYYLDGRRVSRDAPHRPWAAWMFSDKITQRSSR